MTSEENRRRKEDAHVKYLKGSICDKDKGKPFVFVSYKSEDWNVALHKIVYSLVKDYGLNVYFDGCFDTHNSMWLEQFKENMESGCCKGVLAFLDDEYATSYTTVLELMYSQTLNSSELNTGIDGGLPVVLIMLKGLTEVSGEGAGEDTGLGGRFYPDGTKNINAGAEKKLFDETFDELVGREILSNVKYRYKKERLSKVKCSKITEELVEYLEVSVNEYQQEGFLYNIVQVIKDACGEEVFGQKEGVGQTNSPMVGKERDSANGDSSVVGKESSPKGQGGKKKKRKAPGTYYFTLYNVCYKDMLLKDTMQVIFEEVMGRHPDKLEELLSSFSCLEVGDRISKDAVPTVFRSGTVIEINGKRVSIGTSLDSVSVFRYIKRLIELCGEPEGSLIFAEPSK